MTKYETGDRVEVTIVGVVVPSFSHDVVRVAAGQGDIAITLHEATIKRARDVQVRKLPPRKPDVGEVIDGARLKATPWKRGTTVASVSDPTDAYLLTAAGFWYSVIAGSISFSEWYDTDRVKVVYLPESA